MRLPLIHRRIFVHIPRPNHIVCFTCIHVTNLIIYFCVTKWSVQRSIMIHKYRLYQMYGLLLLSCLPRVNVTSFCLQSYQGLLIDRLLLYYSYPQGRINTQVIYRFAVYKLMFYLTIINKIFRRCHFWLARQ